VAVTPIAPVTAQPSAVAVPKFEPLQLVPADTLAVLRIASLATLSGAALKISAIAERTGNDASLDARLKLALLQAGVDLTSLRQNDPIVMAVRMPQGSLEPQFVVYAPWVGDPLPENDTMRQTSVAGNYIAITQPGVEAPPSAPPDWCTDLGTGLLHMRVDVRSAMRRAGPMLPVIMAKVLPTDGLQATFALEVHRQRTQLMELLQGAHWIDAIVNLNEGKLSLATEIEVEGGPLSAQASKRGNPLAPLARHLAADVPMVGAVAFDVQNEAQMDNEELLQALELLPKEVREAVHTLYSSSVDFMGRFDPGAVMLLDPTPGSMHVACVLQSSDPVQARAAFGDMLAMLDFDAIGFDLSLPERSRIGNAVVEDFKFRFDTRKLDFDARSAMRTAFESFLGDADLHFQIASTGREMMFVLGADTAATTARVRAFSAPNGAPPDLAAGLAALGKANPGWVWRIDVARFLTLQDEVRAALMGESAAAARRDALRRQPDVGSVPVVIWAGIQGSRAVGGLEVHLDHLERAAALLAPR